MPAIALMQLRVIPNDLQTNLAHIREMLPLAKGADIALLPEGCDLGWASSSALRLAQPVPGGSTVQYLQNLAKEFGIHIIAGITERDGDQIYNTAVFLSDRGELLGKYRKINLVKGVEDRIYSVGDRLMTYDTRFGKIGITICADNTMQSIVLAESLIKMGAEMILAPSAWAVPPEELNAEYGSTWTVPFNYLAEKYGITIASVSNVGLVTDGAWAGWSCIGNSIAVAGKEKKMTVLAHGEAAEEVYLLRCGTKQ